MPTNQLPANVTKSTTVSEQKTFTPPHDFGGFSSNDDISFSMLSNSPSNVYVSYSEDDEKDSKGSMSINLTINTLYFDQFVKDFDTSFLDDMEGNVEYEDMYSFDSMGDDNEYYDNSFNFEEEEINDIKDDEIIFDLEDEKEEYIEEESESEITETNVNYNALPFWFSNEDEDHLMTIWDMYMEYLNVANMCRCFNMFIGKIRRQKVENKGDMFMTLDNIEIYKKNPSCPLGGTMPLYQTITLLTTWNNEGLPVIFKDLSKDDKLLNFWEQRLVKSLYSIIYCHPIWESDCDFEFSVSPDDKTIGYAKEPFNYTKYIPQRKVDEDSEENFDL